MKNPETYRDELLAISDRLTDTSGDYLAVVQSIIPDLRAIAENVGLLPGELDDDERDERAHMTPPKELTREELAERINHELWAVNALAKTKRAKICADAKAEAYRIVLYWINHP